MGMNRYLTYWHASCVVCVGSGNIIINLTEYVVKNEIQYFANCNLIYNSSINVLGSLSRREITLCTGGAI